MSELNDMLYRLRNAKDPLHQVTIESQLNDISRADVCRIAKSYGIEIKHSCLFGVKKNLVNHDKIMELYLEGFGDYAISDTLNIARSTVRYWRSQNDMPPIGKGKTQCANNVRNALNVG